jgi:selenocysteine-specific elongation factor
MKSIVIGTAGHIDHGKTALVKALTGIDADRLEEEKRRGITIDLGFAHMELPLPGGEKLRLGFVDVPGHERFVRNMLAGVGGIDLVLLVIAADESIKPQTREHFEILQLIGVKRGITVLTKADAVDAETLDVVRLEVEDFLKGTFLEPPQSPIVAVSALTGSGIDELKRAIVGAAAEIHARDSQAIPRLPIDRVFTMKGFGTVITGTLMSGTIAKDQELELFPGEKRVRVRGVQVHGESAGAAMAGQRTALNLSGASPEDLKRGMTLAPPMTFVATRTADVQLELLRSAPRPLQTRVRVHFHCNTMEAVAEVRLIKKAQIAPGETVFARLVLPEPALLLPGDRFIVRQFSPVVTIGGGVVLDATPSAKMPKNDEVLTVFAQGDIGKMLRMRILRRGASGISISQLTAETGLGQSGLQEGIARPLKSGELLRISDVVVNAAHLEALKLLTRNAVADFHKTNPLETGMTKENLREKTKAPQVVFEYALNQLVRERQIAVKGDIVHLPGQGVLMKDEEAESKKKIEDAFASAALKVPALQEVIAGLKVDKARAQKIVTLLLRDKILIKISDDLVFHRAALEALRRQMAEQKTKSSRMDVATFKALTGVSRKYAIPLLEYLDRERITKRVGDAREIL